ncbi:hypothetical protein QJS66_04035 [Kocuria rhizophila]|nr:hypothetical protein QJS66_04035 [Kocuria rhizophila]
MRRMGVDVGEGQGGRRPDRPRVRPGHAAPDARATPDPKAFDVKIITRLCRGRGRAHGVRRACRAASRRSMTTDRHRQDYAAMLVRRLGSRGCTTQVRLVTSGCPRSLPASRY